MNFISKIGIFSGLSQDIIFLLIIAAAGILLGLFVGRFRIISVMANSYISLVLLSVVPQKFLPDPLYAAGLFILLIVILTALGKRIFDAYLSAWPVFVLSFLEVVFIVSAIFSLVPQKTALQYVSRNIYEYLVAPNFHLIWMVAPILFVILIQKRLNR